MSAPLVLTSTKAQDVPLLGNTPRMDFVELACALGGQVVYPPSGGGLMARLEQKTASDWRQAWTARGTKTAAYLSLSEKIGLPLALLGVRHTPHLLLAHHLTSARKRSLQRRTGYLNRFDGVLVLCRSQEKYLRDEAGLSADRTHFLYDKVDHHFWTPQGSADGGYILSVGRERRDYETLIESVRPLNVPTVIVGSSPWSRAGDAEAGNVPAHVTWKRGLSYEELRALYDGASLVVVPLEKGTEYAAGVNGVLEAMAMQKPLVVTNTPGIADYVEDGQTARTVPSADPAALREAITQLLQDGAEAQRLAANARRIVETERNLDVYVRTIAGIVREAVSR